MDVVNMYFEFVIIPLQEEIKKVRRKIYSKSFSMSKHKDIKYLEELEKELEYYFKKLNKFHLD